MRDRIRESQAEALAKWRPLSGATHSIRETYKVLEANLSKAKQAADGAQNRVETLRDDDLMNREGRDRLIREAVQNGRDAVQKHLRSAEAALTIVKAECHEAALPRLDPSRESAARDEFRLLLDASPDPVASMAELVQRDDELAGVAVSSYAESWMRARGIPKAQEAAQSIRRLAAELAVDSNDPARRKVGEAAAQVSALDDALVTTGSITHTSLEAAEEAAVSAGVRGADA